MTSQKEVPGAAAVYLYREENADDFLHKRSVYVRLKVLTEEGKKYGHIAIDYARGTGWQHSGIPLHDRHSAKFGAFRLV